MNPNTGPFIKMLTEDKKYAQDICNDVANTRKNFIAEYTDQILDVSKKYNYAGVSTWVGLKLPKKKGSTITDYDKIMETYLWLCKTLFNKSCSYRGDNGARFSTYIIGKLRNKNTKIDWIRSKKPNLQGVNIPQKTGHVPKSIEKLGKDYEKIFKLLLFGVPPDEIPYKLDINYIEFMDKYEEIVSILAKAGKLLLIQKPTFNFIDDEQNNVEIKISTNMENNTVGDHCLKDIVPNILDGLTKAEFLLIKLYWCNGLSAKMINESFSRDEFKHYLKEMSIIRSSDIPNRITRTAIKCKKIAIDKFPNEQEFISRMNMRNVLKIYFQFFYEEKN